MAVIQKIRNRAGLLVAVIIGMALVAFILGDLLKSGNQIMRKANNNVAVVNGKGISIEIFQKIIFDQEELAKMQSGKSSLDEQTTQDIRQRAWNDLIQNLVLDREVEKLGLAVCSDELFDMVNGDSPHPFIMQFFADPNTGVINRAALNQFLLQVNDLDETNQQKKFWLYLEDMIYKERKTKKYNTLLIKGLYVTNLEADRRKNESNTSVNFSYVVKRYNEVADSLIDIKDADIKHYYNEHKNEYKQEKSRDIRYVVWEVVPSEKDFSLAEAWINEVKGEFEEIPAENSEQYAKANSDIAPDLKNYTKGELDAKLDSFAFAANVGDIIGPYFEDNYFKLTKLSKIDYLPDSVRASHILLAADQNSDIKSIQKMADSLKTMVENGANINELAILYSEDQSVQQNSGNLGWFTEGKMVKPFNDSCFYGKTGDVKLVLSQFGFHILKIEAQSRPTKKVKISTKSY